jgi:hypothetical protein
VTSEQLTGADKRAAVEDIVHRTGPLLYPTPRSDGTDGIAQPWQLALDRARSTVCAHAGADGTVSGCCGGLAWSNACLALSSSY